MIDIILLEPETAGNVGAICRVMANFGFYKLILVNPKCDITSDDFAKRAKHGKDKVQLIIKKKIPHYSLLVATTAKINSDYNVDRMPIRPEELAQKLRNSYSSKSKKSIAIMFGRESSGLTNKEIATANLLVTIDADEKYPTLNLSHAVAIILYELHKFSKAPKVMRRIEMAREIDYNQLNKMVSAAIEKHDYRGEYKTKVIKKIWHNVFAKAFLTRREAFGLMGLLRKLTFVSSLKKGKRK